MNPTTVVVYLVGLYGGTLAYLFGAPKSACLSMTPGHKVVPQTSPSPYRVTVSKSSYSGGDSLRITLQGTERFGGFLLEARRIYPNLNTDQPIGAFNIITGSKRVSGCGDGVQAVTHTAGLNMKTTMTFRWTAPVSTTGNLVFLATFAKNFTTYWVKVSSAEVQAIPTTTTITTTAKPTTAVAENTTMSRLLAFDFSCGEVKGCFVDCIDILCYTVVSWEFNERSPDILFRMQTVVSGSTNQWMAIGFSQDEYMGDDSVVECVASGGQYSAHLSYNSNYNVNSRDNEATSVHLQGASLVDNVFSCSVRRQIKEHATFDLRQASKWHILFAHGDTSDEGVKQVHSHQSWDKPVVSLAKLNLDYPQLLGTSTLTNGVTQITGASFVLVSTLLTLYGGRI